jgi:hypothetical protein
MIVVVLDEGVSMLSTSLVSLWAFTLLALNMELFVVLDLPALLG